MSLMLNSYSRFAQFFLLSRTWKSCHVIAYDIKTENKTVNEGKNVFRLNANEERLPKIFIFVEKILELFLEHF